MPTEPRPNRTRPIALILLVMVLLGAGAWWTWGRSETTDDSNTADTSANERSSRDDAVKAKQERRRDHAPLERVVVGGRVTRAKDGVGVAGATVLLTRKGMISGQAPLSATTDETGQWQLVGVDPGRYLLSATAAGFLPATRTDLRLASGVDRLDLDLAVDEGGQALSGRVTDIGGGAIEGVLIQIADTTEIDLGFGRAPVATLTDEEGHYAVQLAKGRYALSTWHPDYVAAVRPTEIRDGPREENFELVPGGTIEGVVLARGEGQPVAGALVTFADSRSSGSGGFTSNLSFDGGRAISDEQGRFVLRGVRSGVVALSARASGHASTSPLEIPLGIGEQVSGIELWVEPAFTLAGFVVPRGDPEGAIEGVLVGAWQMSPPTLLAAIAPTGEDGYFEIQGVRAGTWQVGAIDEDHLMVLMGASATVKDQDVRDLVIELDSGLRIRGRVDPPQSARISVQLDPGSMSLGNIVSGIMDGMAGAHTDERGEFEVGPVVGGGTFGTRKLKLAAFAESGDRGEIEVEIGREDLANVVIPLTPRASVAGTVLDDRGVPQTHVIVEVRPVARGPGSRNFSMDLRGDGSPTGQDGRFAVRGLDLGKHQVVVEDAKGRALDWAEGLNPAGVGEPLAIEIEDIVDTQYLDLRVVPRDGVITGAVLDAEGLPVVDAWVSASLDDAVETVTRAVADDRPEERVGVVPKPKEQGENDWARSSWFAEAPVLTDENGFFTIAELRRGSTYQIVAESDRGSARAVANEVAPGSRITLTLESLTTIAGKVVRKGKPVERYVLELRGPVRRELEVFDVAGEFEVERLDPGEYTVSVQGDEGRGEAEVEVASGDQARVTIELEDWAVLTGKLVAAASGEPMAGIAVFALADAGGMNAGGGLELVMGKGPKTEADGEFRVEKVAPGKGSVGFVDRDASLIGGGEVAEAPYEVEAGETLDLGTIRGLPKSDVPLDERGSLQMRTRVAGFADRPRPPGTELDEDEPGEDVEAGPQRLWVYAVEVGGVADRAGLEPGDEILTIDGQSVANLGAATAQSLLDRSRLRIGQAVRIESQRGEDRKDSTLEAVAEGP